MGGPKLKIKQQIPNFITLGNLYCGFLSTGYATVGEYRNAAILILIGMMLDSMDGKLARMLHVQSPIGKQLDSLADIVTFGVAPCFLVYYTAFFQYGILGFIITGLFPLFGAYRLARFNVESEESDSNYFTGIPITAAGGILALLTLFNNYIPSIITLVIFIALCFLMISNLKIPSFKNVPLPRYETIITITIGAIILVILISSYQKFPYLFFPYSSD